MPRRNRGEYEDGFGLVELIIAIFLLALISIALIPALYNGLIYSAQQATTATATRQLNALIEQARATPTCANLGAITLPQTFNDGVGHPINSSGTVGSCSPGRAVDIQLVAKDESGVAIATVKALVYVP